MTTNDEIINRFDTVGVFTKTQRAAISEIMDDARHDTLNKLSETILKNRFMPDGITPKCQYCGKAMKNYIPKHGRFKGQVQKHEWICDCPRYPKGMVLSVG